MPLHSALHFEELGSLKNITRIWFSFSQESGELFASATNTLFGPSFPEKAAEQLRTLRQALGGSSSNRSNQVFSKAPLRYTQRGGANPTPCREEAVTLTTEEQEAGEPQ